MADGFLRALAGDEFDVISAGSGQTPLDPDAVAAMSEVGIEISGHEPKAVNRYLGRRFSYVVCYATARRSGAARSSQARPGACTGIWKTLRRSPRLAIDAKPCAACAMRFSGM